MNNVVIYRHQLFKPSEPFIQQQACALKEFNPVFVGRTRMGSPDENWKVFTLDDHNDVRRRVRIIHNAITRDPGVYLERLENIPFSLIHAHFGVDGLYALELAEKRMVPLVTTFHGYDATMETKALMKSRKVSWINYSLFRNKLAQRGNFFICVSAFIFDRVVRLGFPEERMAVHYIGIDVQSIQPIKKLSSERKIILHVARLVEKKGTEYLIRAFKQIVGQYDDIHLVIIGDGPLKKKLMQLAKNLNLESSIEFLGECTNNVVLDWMAKSTIFCSPSVRARSGDSEGLAMVLLEAAAMKLPVVATKHGGFPEAVLEGKTGFLVSERSEIELAERLRFLLDNESLRIDFGNAARKMVEEKFNLRRQAQRLEEIYKSL